MAQDSFARALALKAITEGGGGSGTSDYSQLSNKPQINSVTLTGNKTLSDLGIPTYSAGSNISINDGVISATDTTYSAGENITITGTTISATVPSLEGYATESWVTSQDYLSSSDLSGYATESFVTSQGYITSSALSGYATESWVGSQGYLTAVPSEYATKTYVDSAYTAGSNITINAGVISATDTTYTAGSGISITNNVISATGGGGASYTAGTGIDITNDVISCTYSAGTATQYDPTVCLVTQADMYNWDNKLNAESLINDIDPTMGGTHFVHNGSEISMYQDYNDTMSLSNETNAVKINNSTKAIELDASYQQTDTMTMQDINNQAYLRFNKTIGNNYAIAMYAKSSIDDQMDPTQSYTLTKTVTLTPTSFNVDGAEIATQAYVDSAIGNAIGGSY